MIRLHIFLLLLFIGSGFGRSSSKSSESSSSEGIGSSYECLIDAEQLMKYAIKKLDKADNDKEKNCIKTIEQLDKKLKKFREHLLYCGSNNDMGNGGYNEDYKETCVDKEKIIDRIRQSLGRTVNGKKCNKGEIERLRNDLYEDLDKCKSKNDSDDCEELKKNYVELENNYVEVEKNYMELEKNYVEMKNEITNLLEESIRSLGEAYGNGNSCKKNNVVKVRDMLEEELRRMQSN